MFNATTGNLITSVFDPTPATHNQFGWAVDVNEGRVLVSSPFDNAGATDAGEAYLFDSTGQLLQTFANPDPNTYDLFGRSVALSGNIAAIGTMFNDDGSSNAGAVYLFDVDSGALLQTLTEDPPRSDSRFGGPVQDGVAMEGNTLITGAYQHIRPGFGGTREGIAYVYEAASVPAPAPVILLGLGFLMLSQSRRVQR